MRLLPSILLALAVIAAMPAEVSAVTVNGIIGNLMETGNINNTTVVINGGAPMFNIPDDTAYSQAFTSGDSFTFSETDMDAPAPLVFNHQNRHEFRFSADGGNTPLSFDPDWSWTVSLDITIDSALPTSRKGFAFTLYESGTGANTGQSSSVNLTTSRPPADNANQGANAPPGESSVFGGNFQLQRVIGPCNSTTSCNTEDLNPTTGYIAGTQVSMTITHSASPDGGITPGTIVYSYTDTSGTYSNVLQDLRNTGVFKPDYEMGFIIRGVGRDSFGADFDTDVDVDGKDFLSWQRGFGIAGSAILANGDANNDDDVDSVDLAYWESLFGATDTTDSYSVSIQNFTVSISDPTPLSAAGTGVPEPASMVLWVGAFLGSFGATRLRRIDHA